MLASNAPDVTPGKRVNPEQALNAQTKTPASGGWLSRDEFDEEIKKYE